MCTYLMCPVAHVTSDGQSHTYICYVHTCHVLCSPCHFWQVPSHTYIRMCTRVMFCVAPVTSDGHTHIYMYVHPCHFWWAPSHTCTYAHTCHVLCSPCNFWRVCSHMYVCARVMFCVALVTSDGAHTLIYICTCVMFCVAHVTSERVCLHMYTCLYMCHVLCGLCHFWQAHSCIYVCARASCSV